MKSKALIEKTIKEVQKINSLSTDERGELGFYATNKDLNQLIKTLRRISNPHERKKIRSIDSLIRQVADYAPLNSDLYSLIKQVVKTC